MTDPPDNTRLRRGTNFDDHIDTAWRSYRIALGDALAGLADDDTTLPIARVGDSTPLLTATLTGAHRIRIRAGDSALPDDHDTQTAAVELLCSEGWRTLRDGTVIIEAGRRHADHLAERVVAALRNVWDVVDPAFLGSPDVGVGAPHHPPEPTIEVATVPTGTEDLLRRTRSAIEQMTGLLVEVDPVDHTIGLPTIPVASSIQASAAGVAIEFCAVLTAPVPDSGSAARYLTTNARRWPGVSFAVESGRVHALLRVDCAVFHRANVQAALDHWSAFLRDSAAEIDRMCSHTTLPETDGLRDSSAPPGLDAVLDLIRDNVRSDGFTVAAICGFDRDTVLRYIRHCAQQANRCLIDERTRKEAGDPTTECTAEANVWRHAIRSLGAALESVDAMEKMRRRTPDRPKRRRQ
ncbi:hypothetical protein [Gordonia sp. OPL2]|uniref:TY-Chap domain-containing protein n=1 Tax=Gordonia sp. OPL2 TaxID=2486274 RepID=UPI0016558015|nr:hypothetical protein [Gordonia sp. OPL2]RPA06113.1 hypothetical protein EEB19_09550 [Gordonia sp. OPL2]